MSNPNKMSRVLVLAAVIQAASLPALAQPNAGCRKVAELFGAVTRVSLLCNLQAQPAFYKAAATMDEMCLGMSRDQLRPMMVDGFRIFERDRKRQGEGAACVSWSDFIWAMN